MRKYGRSDGKKVNALYEIRNQKDTKDTSEINLLQFIPPSDARLRILTVESNACLPALRQRLPKAEIFVVTDDIDAPDAAEWSGLGVQWELLDYRETPLTHAKQYFDYIIAARCLETAVNPQDIAAGLGTFLKDTGFLLTSFLNVRCWQVLQDMMEGHFYYFCRHMFAKQDMETLLYASFYKDAVFAPIQCVAPDGLVAALEAVGFENRRQDMETEVWLVKAARSTPEIAALKSLYTPAVRRKLSKLLHRIEYEVEPEASLAALWALCDKEMIFPAYLAEFLQEVVIHRERVLAALADAADARGDGERMDELLATLAEDALNDTERAILVRIDGRRQHGFK